MAKRRAEQVRSNVNKSDDKLFTLIIRGTTGVPLNNHHLHIWMLKVYVVDTLSFRNM